MNKKNLITHLRRKVKAEVYLQVAPGSGVHSHYKAKEPPQRCLSSHVAGMTKHQRKENPNEI